MFTQICHKGLSLCNVFSGVCSGVCSGVWMCVEVCECV